jgi:hypothetical protein
MYLFHNTNLNSLKSILKDQFLKSSALLIKEGYKEIQGEGSGLYDENIFVFLSTCEELFDPRISAQVVLYFDSNLLANKTFYISTAHSTDPEELGEWVSTENNRFEYKRKYPKNYKLYNSVLKKLYTHSINVLPKGESFQVFQQVAIKNKIPLDNLVGIEIKINLSDSKKEKITKYINKHYPNVTIRYA